ncbi:MAG: type I-E CRISPR-associated protein Cas5/CasD [Candidatus Lokiarchaeota archaeon]
MSVILLRLEGPMQSWGIGSRFTERTTELEPTKSGILGLISSALGRSREESIEDLSRLKIVVRVDREGEVFYDFHTTLDVLKANFSGNITKSNLGNIISRRFYLADACFLVGIEGQNKDLMNKIINALKYPKWPLYLGRKSFLPSSPIFINNQIIKESLIEFIKKYPWQGRHTDKTPTSLRIIFESNSDMGESRLDHPISFKSRQFRSRNISTLFTPFDKLKQED